MFRIVRRFERSAPSIANIQKTDATGLCEIENVAAALDDLLAQAQTGAMKTHILPHEAKTEDQILAFLKGV